MPNKINLPGILIKPVPIENNGGIIFKFHIGRGSFANPLFFTSPELLKLLPKLNAHTLPKNSLLGQWTYNKERYIPSEDLVFEEHVAPFSFVKDSEKFLNKGIARALEEKCLLELKKRYGQSTIVPFGGANPKRMMSLRRRGINTRKTGVFSGQGVFTYEAKLTKMLESLKARKRTRRRISQIIRKR